jgi:hypothetical protein
MAEDQDAENLWLKNWLRSLICDPLYTMKI